MAKELCWIQRSPKEDDLSYEVDGFIIRIYGQGAERFPDLDKALDALKGRLSGPVGSIVDLRENIEYRREQIARLQQELEGKEGLLKKLLSQETVPAEIFSDLRRIFTEEWFMTKRYGPVVHASVAPYRDRDGDGELDLDVAYSWFRMRVPELGWNGE